MKQGDIAKDDPLGAFFGGGKGKKPAAVEVDVAEPADDEGLGAAQALLDAIHAKDAGGVRDAFSALSLTMSPPGEDDMEMAPESASGGMAEGEE